MSKDFLVEVGTEELPPQSLKPLIDAFSQAVAERFRNIGLQHQGIKPFATPRRLALLISGLEEQLAEAKVEKLGPATDVAFNTEGVATAAAKGFARSCGVSVEQLDTINTDKGERLVFRKTETGHSTSTLLPEIIETALAQLHIDRRMRWGASRVEFVRPVHWVIMLFGKTVVNGTVLGIVAANKSYGHRFHNPGPLTINEAGDYQATLRDAHVITDLVERRQLIRESVEAEAASHNGIAVIDDALLDEVTALNEWPAALSGKFEKRFLTVPAAVLISSMKKHQKYFHVIGKDGQLLPLFITVANIESLDPAKIIAGNEKVIRPRLADATFFYETDLKTSLTAQREKLHDIVFQEKLGSLYDKTERVALLAEHLTKYTNANPELANQAALLSKSDLTTEIVQEFADLQGIMGEHYALAENLDPAVATALSEQYLPRFSGDSIPGSSVGVTIALADRVDTLVGIFSIGQIPTGSSDPFALRRASLAVLRILVEHKISVDLLAVLERSAQLYTTETISNQTIKQVLTYVLGRFIQWFDELSIPVTTVQAVITRGLTDPFDISQRVLAIDKFTQQPEAAALASANKRVANMLDKLGIIKDATELDSGLLTAREELSLAQSIAALSDQVRNNVNRRQYSEALTLLATLQEPVDSFFDKVMVMADDEKIRANRLALLGQLRDLFLEVADISVLAPQK
jgi:glycyl-tRNA synthetase beta chain